MTTFINDVLQDLKNKEVDFTSLTIILPSKRAGLFLKHQLSNIINQPIFSPTIYSIEEFVEELSQLKSISNIELLFEFYNTYKSLTKKDAQDSFDVFSKWAQVLIQDFNEIDRYLIPQNQIFDYLSAIQDLKHWSLENDKTEFVKNYLTFWNQLGVYYKHFTNHLTEKGFGYQGLIYREAVENIQNYIESSPKREHVFLGFNALNTAEKTIIQELLQNNTASIYWDIDDAFHNNKNHDAGIFTRNHQTQWTFFKKNKFNWISENYSKPKNISVIGIPKNIGQAKYIGSILKQLKTKQKHLNSTAVVLGEESLLLPVLNSIPENIQALNITMGLPLRSIPLASLFEQLFYIHRKNPKQYYFKDVIKLLSHPFISPLMVNDGSNELPKLINKIESNNLIYLTHSQLEAIAPKHAPLFELLFDDWKNSITIGLERCHLLIFKIKESLENNKKRNLLSLEHLFQFNTLFNELSRLHASFNHLKDITALFYVYKELLGSETLDFKGEPLEGLQIMGMLESRVLDFETVIISSVNEGILPSGKSQNSFIPFDVKIENGLPTYKEKDAVYTYHFYRLLQRAKNIYILYNTEIDTLTGGEKSRFITQLELEGIHNISHNIIVPKVPYIKETLTQIKKDGDVLQQLKTYAKQGFSPSSLTSYIRNPLDFYYQKVLKIKEQDNVEETVAANTLGTVIHYTLEEFYKPFIGKYITSKDVKDMKLKIQNSVSLHFKELYKEGDISSGKNLIIFEIAKRYISNFLDLEIADLEAGNEIEILGVESENKIKLHIEELDFPVYLRGNVDRIDKRNGVLRIIDYKSGKVDQNKVEVVNWEDLTTDYDKYSKSFQVLTYAYMINKMDSFNDYSEVEAGVISFKNLNAGFLKFTKKDKSGYGAKKESLITQEILNDYFIELKNLILEICNPKIDFIEKEV